MTRTYPNEIPLWKLQLNRILPLWGHRNWIVVADSAYPAQSSPGIDTILTKADHFEVLKVALNAIGKCRHVRPSIYLDSEIEIIRESDAPGVGACRRKLAGLIGRYGNQTLSHDQMIEKLDESAKLFRILILKTVLTVPYASVFIELGCGYWTPEAERNLRHLANRKAKM